MDLPATLTIRMPVSETNRLDLTDQPIDQLPESWRPRVRRKKVTAKRIARLIDNGAELSRAIKTLEAQLQEVKTELQAVGETLDRKAGKPGTTIELVGKDSALQIQFANGWRCEMEPEEICRLVNGLGTHYPDFLTLAPRRTAAQMATGFERLFGESADILRNATTPTRTTRLVFG